MAIDSQRAPRGQPAPADDTWLGPVLVANGVLTPLQAERLHARKGQSLWAAAVADGATDEAIVAAVARAYRVAAADLGAAESRTTTLLPEALARKHQVVPLFADDRVIRIATADPRDLDLEQALRFVTGRDVVFEIASPGAIAEKLDEFYRPERAIQRILFGLEPARIEAVDAAAVQSGADATLDAPVAKLVDAMISDGVRDGVLIADDDPQMRRLIRGVLQRDGFEVVEASDGLDALEIVEQGGIDLVILDVDMPRLDGLGVLEELRAQVRTACLPVIVLTARHGETEEKALDLGAHDYLSKPVQTRSLIARVRAVLKRASS